MNEFEKEVKLDFLEESGLLEVDERKINIATLYEGKDKQYLK